MFSKQQLLTMLQMQDKLNTATSGDWRSNNQDWGHAIFVEAAELSDHYGWKWWKKQEPNMPQVEIELVDIWHFILSAALNYCDDDWTVEHLAERMHEDLLEWHRQWEEHKSHCKEVHPPMHVLQAMVHSAVPGFEVFEVFGHFVTLVDLLKFDYNHMFQLYVGKNVLNTFRGENGYKDGTYQKSWGMQFPEDNDYLIWIAQQLNTNDPQYPHNLHHALTEFYHNHVLLH